ncbi:unnamed protein product [Amaranthus hypochondriacus]
MRFLRLSNFYKNGFFSVTLNGVSTAKAPATARIYMGISRAFFSTFQGTNNDDVEKMTLGKSLASVIVESSLDDNVKDSSRPEMGRIGMKRLLEMRVKKRVKQHYVNGKFYDLFMKVIADPKTLLDAYNCIRVNSNVGVVTFENAGICFESLAEDLANDRFDVEANTFRVSTRGRATKESLVLPNLKLKVVQEAMRIVLEVVYRPYFSKISHGGRNGRGHLSAFKYICKEVSDPDWWFTVLVSKKLDGVVLAKLLSTIEDKINDHRLCEMIRSMFDAQVLNVEFGGFPKGHGLPQEGILSPILLNIYLGLFDDEFHRMSMRYEALDSISKLDEKASQSKLRSWLRRHIKYNGENPIDCETSGLRVYSCRFMDEIFFAISGSKAVAISLKSEVQSYFQGCLHLDVHSDAEIVPCSSGQGVRFAGALVLRIIRDSPAVRAVHKLKEKVKIFALQKQEIWDAGTARIGKKWLAHGLRKVKESEIKHLADHNSLLSKISCYRKFGMETDHWYKQLIKIWLQDVQTKAASSEEFILSKYIAEPSLPPTLRESFYEFQRLVEEYNCSETESLRSLLPSCELSQQSEAITKVIAPINVLKKRLLRYGLVNDEGYARGVRALILQDTNQIIDWFSGIGHRWLRWYRDSENFDELKIIVSDLVRKSCIRTLALKYRIHEFVIEKCFESQLSRISLSLNEDGNSEDTLDPFAHNNDEASMYGILYSGLCQLSLARMVSESRPCNCFVTGCSAAAPCVYILHVMERQKFPGWNTGFSSCIHSSLNRRRIGLCKQHLKDLYMGDISLQSIDFGSWN